MKNYLRMELRHITLKKVLTFHLRLIWQKCKMHFSYEKIFLKRLVNTFRCIVKINC